MKDVVRLSEDNTIGSILANTNHMTYINGYQAVVVEAGRGNPLEFEGTVIYVPGITPDKLAL